MRITESFYNKYCNSLYSNDHCMPVHGLNSKTMLDKIIFQRIRSPENDDGFIEQESLCGFNIGNTFLGVMNISTNSKHQKHGHMLDFWKVKVEKHCSQYEAN